MSDSLGKVSDGVWKVFIGRCQIVSEGVRISRLFLDCVGKVSYGPRKVHDCLRKMVSRRYRMDLGRCQMVLCKIKIHIPD